MKSESGFSFAIASQPFGVKREIEKRLQNFVSSEKEAQDLQKTKKKEA